MSLRILAFVLILALPGLAVALPADIVGFGNSITCWDCNDGSYLLLLEDWGYIASAQDASHGVMANLTSEVRTRLDDWIGLGNTADSLILLTGTPDTYQAVGGWRNVPYDPLETLGNIEAMIQLVLGVNIPLIVVAPPPVMDPCGTAPYTTPTCAEINTSLANLAADLDSLVSSTYPSADFLDLYAIFQADPRFGMHPGPGSLYRDDGLHPRLETGDTLIAESLVPILQAQGVPEPATALLVASGLVLLSQMRRGRPQTR